MSEFLFQNDEMRGRTNACHYQSMAAQQPQFHGMAWLGHFWMARWKWGFTGQMAIEPNWAHEGSSTIFGEVTGRGEGWQTTWLCYFLLSNLLPSRFCLAIQSHQSGHLWPPLKGWPLLLGPASETRHPRTWALIFDIVSGWAHCPLPFVQATGNGSVSQQATSAPVCQPALNHGSIRCYVFSLPEPPFSHL